MSSKSGVATGAVGPRIDRSLTLRFIGDWGKANFHRICSILTQEFCDRAGDQSRVGIWSIRKGGSECPTQIQDGEADLGIATPIDLVARSLRTHDPGTASARLYPRALPNLRALAVLPQNDSMVLAIHPKFGVSTFAQLKEKKPAIRIATGTDDGTCFIGHVATEYLAAHGVSRDTILEWGGSFQTYYRPEDCLFAAQDGEVDAVLQEAIMTPWWEDVIEKGGFIPLPAEDAALGTIKSAVGLGKSSLAAGFWPSLKEELPTLAFQDFLILVHDDMPDDVAYLLTWCLVERRQEFESGYRHIPPHKSPLSYPLVPQAMASSPIPLHPAAARFYQEAGYLSTSDVVQNPA